jgi:hypothetical protein
MRPTQQRSMRPVQTAATPSHVILSATTKKTRYDVRMAPHLQRRPMTRTNRVRWKACAEQRAACSCPYEEDEDDLMAAGMFGRISETVNTARDIAHVLWNVGWRK